MNFLWKFIELPSREWMPTVMMTSSNGNIFRVTGPLCGEFTGPGEFPHKGQWRGALMSSLICIWINGWVNKREAADLRRDRGHCDVNVMWWAYPTSLPTVLVTYAMRFNPDIVIATGYSRVSYVCINSAIVVCIAILFEQLIEQKYLKCSILNEVRQWGHCRIWPCLKK